MNKRNIVTMIVAALIPMTAMAQDEGPEKSLFLGAGLTDGNTETESVTAELKWGGKSDSAETLFSADWSYGEANSVKNVDNGNVALQYNPVLSGDIYGYGRATAGYDDLSAVDYRAVVGAGLGTYLVQSDANELAVEAGPAYVFEDVGGVEEDYLALRFAERSSHQLSDTAKIYQSVEFLPEAEDFDNYLLNAEAGIEAELSEGISMRVGVKDKYDNTPAAGLDENDLALTAGVVVDL